MSPQFVDFDADGHLDIIAGIFDGSPHLVRGSAKGWLAPEQLLDRDGARIVLNAFWNFDTKKWDSTKRCDPPGTTGEGHLTSAIAFDVDGDGDLDLLLGDHKTGRVYCRVNEGTAKEPRFAPRNEVVEADGNPIDVPGTVATLRLVDWNGDGRLDLAAGSMGDPWGGEAGGGVFLFPNLGSGKAARFGAPIVLLEPSRKGTDEPVRPDAGLYMDFGDHDGDGDLDMIVGGYSLWTPKEKALTPDDKALVTVLQSRLAAVEREQTSLVEAIEKALTGLDEATADRKRTELLTAQREELQSIAKRQQTLRQQLDALVPSPRRESFVWLYENRTNGAKAPPR